MDEPLLTDDCHANRRVWAEHLRRPDWQVVPRANGDRGEFPNPWEVGFALAYAHWPPTPAIVAKHSGATAIERDIMSGCYGLPGETGEFAAAELPNRIRSLILMAAQAARSALPYPDPEYEDVRDIIADLPDLPAWDLYGLSHTLTTLWEYDPSPMRGAVLNPTEVARLIASILEAEPPSPLAHNEQ